MPKVIINDRMDEKEVEAWSKNEFYQPGVPYLWVLTHGWCCIGYFIGSISPFEIRVAHSNYYRSAGDQTHAQLARKGDNEKTEWEYTGDEVILLPHIIRVTPYSGRVPRQPRVVAEKKE